jgi:hypothetical protein
MAFNEALHELFSSICMMNNQCYLKELEVMFHISGRVCQILAPQVRP